MACDAIIFDLEDAVAPDEKLAARGSLVEVLGRVDYGRRLRLVRINGSDSAWGRADAEAFAGHSGVDGVLVAKINGVADLDSVEGVMPRKPLWAMMEAPLGVLNAASIAGTWQLAGDGDGDQ